jgi:hypothetical protein
MAEPDDTDFDLTDAISKWMEENTAKLVAEQPTATTSTSTSATTGTTVGESISITEQISRRFFDVPTPEKFLDNFETAYGGFLENMRDSGLGPGDIGLALDPATGLMDLLLGEYMGGLAQRAAAGEDIFSIVGTEEDFELLRTEPGTESVTRGKSGSVSTSRTGGTSSSRSEKEGGQLGAAASQEARGGVVARAPGVVSATSTGESRSTSQQTSKQTSESTFKGVTELLSRPETAAVFKFSPTDFLQERFNGDAGELATFIQSRKGERQRQRQTLAGGPVVTARRA